MIFIRRAASRHRTQRRRQDVWHTFHSDNVHQAFAGGFGTLETLDEDSVPPGATVVPRHAPGDAEIVTYVREGAIAFEDSTGHSGVLNAGEFQCLTTGYRVRHTETNASRTEWAQILQLRFRPSSVGRERAREQKRFSAAERRSGLCVVAAPDARRGALRLHQDAMMYSAILDPGQHIVHELPVGRCAWLHLVRGQITVSAEVVLTAGDGAGICGEPSVSFTADVPSEVLLVDVFEPADFVNSPLDAAQVSMI